MDYFEIMIDQNVVRDRSVAVLPENFSFGIHHHRISETMLRGPCGCLLGHFFDADGKNLESLISKPLPDLFFDNRSLLLARFQRVFQKTKNIGVPLKFERERSLSMEKSSTS